MPAGSFQGVIEYLRRTVAANPGTGVSDGQLLDRFVAGADEAAFELLVWRHGKMVMGACQRLLRDPFDAEDAFQACFLALAKRAKTISRRESVGAWLYQVAYRLALNCRTRDQRRRMSERPLETLSIPGSGQDPATSAGWREVRPLLDEAVHRLPDRFRVPFVLRHLEGWSNRQIASELGCSEGTVESRLTRARQRLRVSLSRKGISLGGILLAAAAADETAGAVLSKTLVIATAHSAAGLLGQSGLAATLSPNVALLTRGVLQAMFVAKLKTIATAALVVTLVGGGTVITAYHSFAAAQPGALAIADQPAAAGLADEEIARLIEQLGSDKYSERERAARALDTLGSKALDPLRAAARDDNLERKRRAEELVQKIEGRQQSSAILAPKRVHLVYNNTPLKDAAADFSLQSGYGLALSDPGNRLKGRTITLDTGNVPFWKALALFCAKGELMETASAQAANRAGTFSAVGGGGGGVGGALRAGGFGANAWTVDRGHMAPRIVLTDGIPDPLPSYLDGAVRIRALSKLKNADMPADESLVVPLEVTPEPRIQWQRIVGVEIDKAIDDLGQTLVQAAPGKKQSQAANAAAPLVVQQNNAGVIFTTLLSNNGAGAQIHLKKGDKPTKVLKEVAGKVLATVQGKSVVVLTATDIMNSTGKVAALPDGGTFELVEATKNDRGKILIRIALEGPAGAPAPARLAAPAAAAPAGALQPQAVQAAAMLGQVVAGRSLPAGGSQQEFTLIDDQEGVIPKVGSSMRSGPGKAGMAVQYELTFDAAKNKGAPSKLVYSMRSPVIIEIPFTLKDVPLPSAGENEEQE